MRRSLGLFLIAALLPLVVFGVIVGTSSFRAQRTAIEAQARDHAGSTALLVGRELVANMRAIWMISQSPAFDGALDDGRLRTLASRFIAQEPLWRTISVSDPAGNRLLDVPEPIGGVTSGRVVELASHAKAVEQRRTTVGRIMPGARNRPAFAVRSPVIRDGRVTHVVSTVIEPSQLGRLLLAEMLPTGWTVELIDGAGNLIARSGDSARFIGRRASESALAARSSGPDSSYRGDGLGGGEQVGIWARVPDSDWTVHVAMPASAYNEPLYHATEVLVLGIVASLGLVLLLASLLARDMKQHRQRDAAIIEGQRLEALGRMTGGVAHDFNNLLTPIIGGLDLLQRRLSDDPRSSRLIDGALISAERAKTLVSRLLAFARRQTLEPRDVDLRVLLNGLTDLLERSIGTGVIFAIEVPDDLPSARVDPAQLELAILNLAVNARDAMSGVGTLVIAAEAADASTGPSGLKPGPYVRITLIDDGAGMDAATLQRAIEPFFTTKEAGKGTGLGLSMVHGLAAQSGGALRLVSDSGAGTRAEIWLPAGAPVPAVVGESARVADLRTGRILVVDDDELARASIAEMLRDHGHHVVEASCADDALAVLGSGDTDVIVTDYVMPRRSGAELIREARLLRPGIPVLLVTGFANAAEDVPAEIPRLPKPFRRFELLNRVAELLTEGREEATRVA